MSHLIQISHNWATGGDGRGQTFSIAGLFAFFVLLLGWGPVAADDWQTDHMRELFGAILRLEDRDEAAAFLRDLCTLGELRDMAQRWAVVRMLEHGLHYADISRRTGASTATITRIASWLHHGEGGGRGGGGRRRGAGARPAPAGVER
jgi:TrpR-related protein YerC/YecD